MTDLYELLTYLYPVAGFVAVWLVICVSGALPVFMLAKVDLEPLPEGAVGGWLEKVFSSGLVDQQCLEQAGFEPIAVYKITKQMANPHMVVWQRQGERTYFCVYVLMGAANAADFVSCFEQGALTTGTSRDGLLLPPRLGHWMQAFRVKNVGQQWGHHAAALEFLRVTLGKSPSTEAVDFREEFVGAVRGHAAYVRSLSLWYLRIPYWYVARRFGLYRKTVQAQFERPGGAIE